MRNKTGLTRKYFKYFADVCHVKLGIRVEGLTRTQRFIFFLFRTKNIPLYEINLKEDFKMKRKKYKLTQKGEDIIDAIRYVIITAFCTLILMYWTLIIGIYVVSIMGYVL